jgi:N4-gp56 family major capsid protein
MAATEFGVGHALAQKLWARKLFHESIGKDTFFGRFVGKSDTSLVQWKTETQKDAGDRITVGLRMLLTGNGIQGDSTLEGNEEALATRSDNLLINQLRHAVRSQGKMSEQRVPFSVREEMRMGLQDWWTERLETSLANQLTGYADQSDSRFTGNNTAVEPSTGRIVVGGGHDTEASLSLTTTHAIALSDLDRAVAKAKVVSPRIRPLRIDGKSMYVAFLHPYQIYRMRRDASTAGNFFDVQKAAMQGSQISDNPIVTGGNFIYNNVIVHEWSYLPIVKSTVTSASSYRRGVFCGAQAAIFGVGQGGSATEMSWEEDLFDYGNQLGVSAGMIYGVKKTIFTDNGASADFGTIVLSGYAPTP